MRRPAISHEWLAGRLPLPVYVVDPAPHRPHALMLFDAEAMKIIATTVVKPDASNTDAAKALLRSRLASGDAIAPRLRVADEDFAKALRRQLGKAVDVYVGPTPELEDLRDAMTEALGEAPREEVPSYLLGGDASPETVGSFFEAAAAVYRLAPWSIVREDSMVLKLDAPKAGYEDACVSITGQQGVSPAVLVLDSIPDFEAFSIAAAAADAERWKAEGPGARLFGVSFDAGNELPKDMLREAIAHRWPVASASAYPTVVQMDADGVPRPVVAGDYVFATALLRALARFFERHKDVFRRPPEHPAKLRVACEDLPGKPVVILAAPHPSAYWQWGRETLLEYHFLLEADDIIEHFAAARAEKEPDAAIRERETRVLVELLRFKVRVAGEHPLGWHPKLLDAYLTEYLPREVDVLAEDVEATPSILDAFFAWLSESQQEERDAAAKVREGIRRLTPAFLREVRNPANFGVVKKVTIQVRTAGIPLEDDQRIAELVRSHRDELIAELAQRPRELEAGAPGSAATRKPWVWTPGTPPPDPKGACPCGSGRRYKRCCMPR